MTDFFEDRTQAKLHNTGKKRSTEKGAKAKGLGNGNGNGQKPETGALDDGQFGSHGPHPDGLDKGGHTRDEDGHLNQEDLFLRGNPEKARDDNRYGDVAHEHGQHMLETEGNGAFQGRHVVGVLLVLGCCAVLGGHFSLLLSRGVCIVSAAMRCCLLRHYCFGF